MTVAISERPVDPNVQLVIEDIRALRTEMQGAPEGAVAAHLTQLAAGYLVVNRPVLDLAFEAWRQTPEEVLKQMCAEDRVLDDSAAWHAFEPIGRHIVQLAPDIMRGAAVNVLRVDEDDLNMLLRVLDYALYLADCSGETVHWHPVRELLAGETDRIDELRASLSAE
jgi:hypothetical protein